MEQLERTALSFGLIKWDGDIHMQLLIYLLVLPVLNIQQQINQLNKLNLQKLYKSKKFKFVPKQHMHIIKHSIELFRALFGFQSYWSDFQQTQKT